MKKSIAIILAVILSVTLLSGCGGEKGPVLKVFNWGEYIDMSVLDDFTAEVGDGFR